MKPLYYLRDGTPCTMEEWGNKLKDFSYRKVEQTELKKHSVSTIWLGLDHDLIFSEEPIIFETMVFKKGTFKNLDMRRYSTEEQAKRGHSRIVRKWKTIEARK